MNKEEKALNELVALSENLEDVDYEYIKDLIKNTIRSVPVTTTKLHKGAYIDRVRPNIEETLFFKEDEISYIKDKEKIEKYLLDYGRANKPHEVLFYGAIESSSIPEQRLTAIYETCDFLKSKECINLKGQLVTLSRWEVLNELEIVEIVFSDDALKNNPDTQKAFKFHFQKIMTHPLREIGLQQLKFFSNQFARKINTHNDYKISVAYADLVMNHNGFAGVAYPSVASDYAGQNVVLRPDIVDEHLSLKNVVTMRVHKNKMHSFVNNHKLVTTFGRNNSNFIWEDIDQKYVADDNEINHHLKIIK